LVPGQAQRGIGVGIGPTGTGGHGDFTDDLCPELAALGVLAPFAVLDVCPFAVSGHDCVEFNRGAFNEPWILTPWADSVCGGAPPARPDDRPDDQGAARQRAHRWVLREQKGREEIGRASCRESWESEVV